MINVLMVGPGINQNGGIASVVKSYIKCGLFEDDQIQVKYLSTWNGGGKIRKTLTFIKSCVYGLPQIIKSDIVHIHTSYGSSFRRKRILGKISKVFNKKVIYHIHGSEFEKYYLNTNNNEKIKISKSLEQADLVIALSNEWKEKLRKISGNARVKVLVNSIEVPKMIRKKYGKNKILFLGRLGERKGVYDILEIANSIIEVDKNVEFIFAGDGDIDKISQICKEKHIESNVKITGWINGDEKTKYIIDSDIFILPSYNEGMPISILEAMSYQIPILSTEVGGIPQLVRNNIDGFLIKPGDTKSLKEKLTLLIQDNNLKKELGSNGYNRVKKDFNLEHNLVELKQIYTKMNGDKIEL